MAVPLSYSSSAACQLPRFSALSSSLFLSPLHVNPDARDSTTQQIQSKLGNYSLVKHLLDEPKRLIGIEGVPPSPAPSPSPSSLRTSSSSVGSNSRSSPSTQEFKKPGGPRSSGGTSSSSSSASSSSAVATLANR
ncbi:PREDICTED: serine/arginine repetitive matrix protein 2-like [Habropoda laboriosa]|uniref:serine/arginine repetitive matrix protein 2-like n=1 Tax=Habropoda laboriosa TaxID=597456 RepID=UPI00083D58A9|nr:PREDICTED: serine/arginine repetitive matrix protein 2-like [Habropoda laboriosa]